MNTTPTDSQLAEIYREDRIRNYEFQISFSETNLRWLAGEPSSPHNDRCKAVNLEGIEYAKAAIADLKTATTEELLYVMRTKVSSKARNS